MPQVRVRGEEQVKTAARQAWRREVEAQLYVNQVSSAERQFLEYVRKNAFNDMPDHLKALKKELTYWARGEEARRAAGAAGWSEANVSYFPGKASAVEVENAVARWSELTANAIKREVYPDDKVNPATKQRYLALSADAVRNGVEQYVYAQADEVGKRDPVYGRLYYMILPDMMDVTRDGRLDRDWRKAVAHMALMGKAMLHHIGNVRRMGSLRDNPLLDSAIFVNINPDRMTRMSDNMLELSRDAEFLKLMEVVGEAEAPERERRAYAQRIVSYLASVENETVRNYLVDKAITKADAGLMKDTVDELEANTQYDFKTLRLMPMMHTSPDGEDMNVLYQGVRKLSGEKRRILAEVVVVNAGHRGHNQAMIDPLIEALGTHRNSVGDLEKLAWAYSGYVRCTKDAYPDALRGFEGESLDVKLRLLNHLAGVYSREGGIYPAEAERLKKAVLAAGSQERKLGAIQDDAGRRVRDFDGMLKEFGGRVRPSRKAGSP